MPEPFDLPAVPISRHGEKYEAVGILELDSILKAELIHPIPGSEGFDGGSSAAPVLPIRLQVARESFLASLVSWLDTIVLEVRLTFVPDLATKSQGKCRMGLVIRSEASRLEEARHTVMRSFLDLRPLISACFPEICFRPIPSAEDVEGFLSPFIARHALAVIRKQNLFDLSSPLNGTRLGFAAASDNPQGPDKILQTFPFYPSLDDWSRLLDFLASLIDPITVLVRVRPRLDLGPDREKLERDVTACERVLAKLQERQLPLERHAAPLRDLALDRLGSMRVGAFDSGVFLLSPERIHPSAGAILGAAMTDIQLGGDRLFYGMFLRTHRDTHGGVVPSFLPGT